MDLYIYPNNRAIGRVTKYAKVTKKGSYQFKTPADQPIPLKAESSDWHVMEQWCGCPTGSEQNNSMKTHIVPANIRIEWELVEGEGGFVKMSQSPTSKKTTLGDEVLYQPPHLDRANSNQQAAFKRTKIKVSSHHDDSTKTPDHQPLQTLITMEIQLIPNKTDPSKDEYLYDYWVDDNPSYSSPTTADQDSEGGCIPEHTWLPERKIDGYVDDIPAICPPNDFILLEAKGTKMDKLKLQCTPGGGGCNLPSSPSPGTDTLSLSDVLTYYWTASDGEFPLGAEHGGSTRNDSGREAVWHAPENETAVRISLLISDSKRQYISEPIRVEYEIIVKNKP